jgi:hypothetical protein
MKQSITYSTPHSVYFISGGVYGGTISAPTRKQLLEEIKKFCDKHKNEAEVITFGPIKKTVETWEVKGKFTIFREITNTFLNGGKNLRKFYKEINL